MTIDITAPYPVQAKKTARLGRVISEALYSAELADLLPEAETPVSVEKKVTNRIRHYLERAAIAAAQKGGTQDALYWVSERVIKEFIFEKALTGAIVEDARSIWLRITRAKINGMSDIPEKALS
jgi:hypothetical protein